MLAAAWACYPNLEASGGGERGRPALRRLVSHAAAREPDGVAGRVKIVPTDPQACGLPPRHPSGAHQAPPWAPRAFSGPALCCFAPRA
eukprot:11894706-Alexandrium_andersonii.AAC.1